MSLRTDEIIAIVSSQINANMQKHMRGYLDSDTQNYSEEKEFNQEEQIFSQYLIFVMRFLYNDFPQHMLEKFYNENTDSIVNYLRSVNEEILSSNDFTKAIIENKPMIKCLVTDDFFVSVGAGVSKRIKVTPSISYIPSIDNTSSNIIRIGITEEQNLLRYGKELQYLNGTIDIFDDGKIVYNLFSKDTLKIELEDTDKGLVILKDEEGNTKYKKESISAKAEDANIDKDGLVIVSNLFKNLLEKVNSSVDTNKIR